MNVNDLYGISSVLGCVLAVVALIIPNPTIRLWFIGIMAIIFLYIAIYSHYKHGQASKYHTMEIENRELFNKVMIEIDDIKQGDFNAQVRYLAECCTIVSDSFGKLKDIKVNSSLNFE